MSDIRLAPSLLSADPVHVAASVERLEGHVELFHVDVMDGHFVPNISPMAPAMVRRIREITDTPLDVHLMVSEPARWIGPYREAGADWLSVHVEATSHLERLLSEIRSSGARAGVVLNPGTGFDGLQYALENGDFVLIMSVNPGFGGQSFLRRSPAKIRALRRFLDEHELEGVEIEVDGGVDAGTAGPCAGAGARILVAGSAIVGAEDPVAAAARIRERARAG